MEQAGEMLLQPRGSLSEPERRTRSALARPRTSLDSRAPLQDSTEDGYSQVLVSMNSGSFLVMAAQAPDGCVSQCMFVAGCGDDGWLVVGRGTHKERASQTQAPKAAVTPKIAPFSLLTSLSPPEWEQIPLSPFPNHPF